MIKLYHGSNVEIKSVDLKLCKPGKDFGKGFYHNPNYEQARKMAVKTFRILGEGSEIVNAFNFNLEAAVEDGLNVKVFENYNEEWAEFIVRNRSNKTAIPVHPYDIVIGPIADDTVGVQIRRFVQGYLPISKLIEELRFHGDKAIQYFFGTQKSLKYISRV